jgi:hypothetical protein
MQKTKDEHDKVQKAIRPKDNLGAAAIDEPSMPPVHEFLVTELDFLLEVLVAA